MIDCRSPFLPRLINQNVSGNRIQIRSRIIRYDCYSAAVNQGIDLLARVFDIIKKQQIATKKTNQPRLMNEHFVYKPALNVCKVQSQTCLARWAMESLQPDTTGIDGLLR
jgi:hypothetical protein